MTLKAKRFRAVDLYPECLKCSQPVFLDGQSQGWTHNNCAPYPPSEAETRFQARISRIRGSE